MVSLQNSYSLLVRADYENGLAECCSPRNHDVGLLAYSPLAGGIRSAIDRHARSGAVGRSARRCEEATFVPPPRSMTTHHIVRCATADPLISGILSAKYAADVTPANSRYTLFPGFMDRYKLSFAQKAVARCVYCMRVAL